MVSSHAETKRGDLHLSANVVDLQSTTYSYIEVQYQLQQFVVAEISNLAKAGTGCLPLGLKA